MSDLLQALIDGGMSPANAVRVSSAIQSAIRLSAAPANPASPAAPVSLQAPAAAQAAPAQSVISVPFETQQSAVFAGDSQFSGPLTIAGEVNWGGMPRAPTPVSVVGVVGADSGSLFFQPLQMAALNDFGLGRPQRVVFTVSPGSMVNVLSGVSVSAQTSTVTNAETGSFHPTTTTVTIPTNAIGSVSADKTYSVLSTLSDVYATTEKVSFPTSYTFDPENCTITASGTTTITYVSTVALTKEPRTVIASLASTAASTTSSTLLTGGTVSVGGSSTVVISGVSASTTSTSVGSASGAAIVASITEPPSGP
jgi:hypothetical protein